MSSHSQPGSDMAPASRKALTSSLLASLKDYVVQADYKGTYDSLTSRVRGTRDSGTRDSGSGQTWERWTRPALGKQSSPSTNVQPLGPDMEKVHLFPGWAVRRYKDPSNMTDNGREFSLDVYISGFASKLRPPEAATRKMIYYFAKGYAALPKLPAVSTSPSPQTGPASPLRFDSPSSPGFTKLPSSPSERTEQLELDTLDAKLGDSSASSSPASPSYGSEDNVHTSHDRRGEPSNMSRKREEGHNQCMTSESYDFSRHREPISPRSGPSTPTSSVSSTFPASVAVQEPIIDDALEKLHANFDSRIKLFWSSAIPNRMIRLSIFCLHAGQSPLDGQDMAEGEDHGLEPLATTCVTTSPQGAFHTILNVPWSRLATHPPSLHVAFGDQDVEYPVVVHAEIWAPSLNSFSASPTFSFPHQPNNVPRSRPHVPSKPSLASPPISFPRLASAPGLPSFRSRVSVSLSCARVPLRLISDIDDTIKHAGVLQGPRQVFRNVFVQHLEELVIHNMADWYKDMWQKGVRFHYVSNSPFELLPVLTEYFKLSSFPEGSIKLKSYAVRSLLPSLLSPPALRKRQGVVEVLDAFPESRFMLVGDTGEQDMELYTELARERPSQVVGVFLRDVSTWLGHNMTSSMSSKGGQGYGTADSSGMDVNFGLPLVDTEPESIQHMPSMNSLSSSSSIRRATSGPNPRTAPRSSPSSPLLSTSHSYSPLPPMTPTESRPKLTRMLSRSRSLGAWTFEDKRRDELESRIARARSEIPSYTAFRVFQEPDECVEVQSILDRYLGGQQ